MATSESWPGMSPAITSPVAIDPLNTFYYLLIDYPDNYDSVPPFLSLQIVGIQIDYATVVGTCP